MNLNKKGWLKEYLSIKEKEFHDSGKFGFEHKGQHPDQSLYAFSFKPKLFNKLFSLMIFALSKLQKQKKFTMIFAPLTITLLFTISI